MNTQKRQTAAELRELGFNAKQISRIVDVPVIEVKGFLKETGSYQGKRLSSLEEFEPLVAKMHSDGFSATDIASFLVANKKLEISPRAISIFIKGHK